MIVFLIVSFEPPETVYKTNYLPKQCELHVVVANRLHETTFCSMNLVKVMRNDFISYILKYGWDYIKIIFQLITCIYR